ncbi:hypothetical protein KCH_15910 [Kitasatospora cheerisanensis KCTC 2395]|uniref:Xylose isomerase-like TIM barrel domain-containing protein n=1 Tax=Kitasatospora cheerisanensis KCTC 2395 TaxID=1348663 RepID=A0A066YYN8_9ACTN|nr:hypothetical protein KCH_15910 [Kitasatospora cheerisanensis KCTC 2395]
MTAAVPQTAGTGEPAAAASSAPGPGPAPAAVPAPAPALAPAPTRLPRPTIGYGGIGDEAAPDLPGQLAALDELGWRELELRTVDGSWIADLPLDRVARIAETIAARGVRVTGLASRIGNWAGRITDDFAPDLAELAALTARAALLGTDRIRVMSYPNAGLPEADWRRQALDRLTRLADLADREGLTLLHENCSGWAGTSAARQLDLMASVDSPALRLLFDAGNGVPHGYDGHLMLRQIADHVAHVHIKDAVGGGDRTTYVLPGDGAARLGESLRFLVERGWSGGWSLEPHLVTRPHQGLAADGADGSGFVAAGRALTALVEREVLPAAPGWRPVPGGLDRPAAPARRALPHERRRGDGTHRRQQGPARCRRRPSRRAPGCPTHAGRPGVAARPAAPADRGTVGDRPRGAAPTAARGAHRVLPGSGGDRPVGGPSRCTDCRRTRLPKHAADYPSLHERLWLPGRPAEPGAAPRPVAAPAGDGDVQRAPGHGGGPGAGRVRRAAVHRAGGDRRQGSRGGAAGGDPGGGHGGTPAGRVGRGAGAGRVRRRGRRDGRVRYPSAGRGGVRGGAERVLRADRSAVPAPVHGRRHRPAPGARRGRDRRLPGRGPQRERAARLPRPVPGKGVGQCGSSARSGVRGGPEHRAAAQPGVRRGRVAAQPALPGCRFGPSHGGGGGGGGRRRARRVPAGVRRAAGVRPDGRRLHADHPAGLAEARAAGAGQPAPGVRGAADAGRRHPASAGRGTGVHL